MSINTAHTNGGVVIYNGEVILLFCDGVELTLEGKDVKDYGGTRKGRIYLTTHRVIFVAKSEKERLQSFSLLFFSMSKVELEQPVFGANFIKGLVESEIGGNWTGTAVFKLKFFTGGAIEFGQALLKAAQIAHRQMPDAPPAYTAQQGPYYPAPPPAYFPPEGGINGFYPPTNVFPQNPPANSVYTSDMPPPYFGIIPSPYANPPTYPSNYPQTYPHPQGAAGGPPPPGFTQPGFAGPGVGPTAPPAYDHSQAPPGAQAQYNGTTSQQAPPPENKAGILYEYYANENRRDNTIYAPYMNGQQGPPPPYFPENQKKEQ